MVIHALQHNGAGGGGAGVYKVDTIKLVIAGKSIGVDLRGAALPTPKPRPHMTILWHPDGFSAADLQKVSEITTAWCYARNIGVLSRVVAFTLEEMDPDEVRGRVGAGGVLACRSIKKIKSKGGRSSEGSLSCSMYRRSNSIRGVWLRCVGIPSMRARDGDFESQ
jgi:hypothetical protein